MRMIVIDQEQKKTHGKRRWKSELGQRLLLTNSEVDDLASLTAHLLPRTNDLPSCPSSPMKKLLPRGETIGDDPVLKNMKRSVPPELLSQTVWVAGVPGSWVDGSGTKRVRSAIEATFPEISIREIKKDFGTHYWVLVLGSEEEAVSMIGQVCSMEKSLRVSQSPAFAELNAPVEIAVEGNVGAEGPKEKSKGYTLSFVGLHSSTNPMDVVQGDEEEEAT